jgi:hypothetical protein
MTALVRNMSEMKVGIRINCERKKALHRSWILSRLFILQFQVTLIQILQWKARRIPAWPKNLPLCGECYRPGRSSNDQGK